MTNPNDRQTEQLTPAQHAAVDAFVLGATISDVAKAVGVSRPTASEWINHNPYFRAEVNRRRQELWENHSNELRSLFPRAIERIREALEEGGPAGLTAALALVRLSEGGLRPTGETDPEEIKAADARAEGKFYFTPKMMEMMKQAGFGRKSEEVGQGAEAAERNPASNEERK